MLSQSVRQNQPDENRSKPQPIRPPVGLAVGQPEAALAPTHPASSLLDDCTIVLLDDGSARVSVYIAPDIMRRIKTRAQSQPLAEYILLNIVRPALTAHVY